MCIRDSAKTIPGKEEFHETLRYFDQRIKDTGVVLRLSTRADADSLTGFDDVVVATGVTPVSYTHLDVYKRQGS